MPNEISPSVERSMEEGVTYRMVFERAAANPYDIPKSIFPLGPTTVCHLVGFIFAIVLFVVCGLFIRIELNRIEGDGSVVMFHGLFGALCFAGGLLLIFCTCFDVRWGFTRKSEWRSLFRRASAAFSRNSRRQSANSESRRQEDIESLHSARAGKDSEETESASEDEQSAEAGKSTTSEVLSQPSQENEPESELLSSGELRRRNLNLNANELPPDSSNSSDEEPKGLRT